MADFTERTAIRGGAAVLAALVGGPVAAYAVWKGAGFALSGGNPLFLLPAGTLLGEGSEAIAAAADGVDADFGGAPDPGDGYEPRHRGGW